jgi:hypothetical protein
MTGSPRHTYPHPQESSYRPHRSRGHRVRLSLCRAYTRLSKFFRIPFFYASKKFLGSVPKVRPYRGDKDPVYQKLLAVQGWALRAENLLYQEEVNRVKLLSALFALKDAACNAIAEVCRDPEVSNKGGQ